ncbi:unnamed protein product [Brachionus calyciflorus]|uniref:Cadherin domain-containing protein n=1 Tax=Brachionus calyciflorus TaxID=104777 RepID=A0A813S4E4_9BILA|nr:unnamed protein product [Brachionus calyciflorus]
MSHYRLGYFFKSTFFLCLLYLIIHVESQNIRPLPKFTQETINKADNIILYENLPLNTEILIVQASSYKEALPISYSILDPDKYFNINSTTGSIRLFSPLDNLKRYQFTIIAQDSATFPNQQSAYLTANVIVISQTDQAPFFNEESSFYVSVLDILTPGTVIYDNIYVTDKNSGQNGILSVYCDGDYIENSDASISCSYFGIEYQMIDLGVYKCLVKLLKPLNYNLKKNFFMSISAQINMKKSTSLLIVDVKKSDELQPKFLNSSYLFRISYEKKTSNTLDVSVINVNLNLSRNTSFHLLDSRNYFTLLDSPNCSVNMCAMKIRLKNRVNMRTSYSMKINFIQQFVNNQYSTSAEIKIVFEGSNFVRSAPSFLFPSYHYYIYENIEPNAPIRNASLTIFEPEALSPFISGFDLEIQSSDSNSPDPIFDITPNYGMGFLIACLKLRPNVLLDYDKGPRRYDILVKATSHANPALYNYANITIFIKDFNEYSPYFDSYLNVKFLNQPETYKIGDFITSVIAHDYDGTDKEQGLFYSIIGPHQNRFRIDLNGQIFLLRKFDFNYEKNMHYNVTILVYDQGGLSNYTNLIIFFNMTNGLNFGKSKFECSIYQVRSELSELDRKTLRPELVIPVNSLFRLKYFLANSKPKINDLDVDSNTGKVFLRNPINSTILNKFDRIYLDVDVYQIQPNLPDNIYFSSITCSATIYLKNIDQPDPTIQEPFFLRTYEIEVEREFVLKTVPLLKIEAILMNPNSVLPIQYSLLDNSDRLFHIDTIQGLIYPVEDFILETRVYRLTGKATDPSNGLFSITKILISVVQKSKTRLECETEYLIAKIDPDNLPYVNGNAFISQLNCSSSSLFKSSSIIFDISAVQTVYNCDGFAINYRPKLGIESTTGRIVSFDKISRDNFCDASFLIFARLEDASITIPFKIVLVSGLVNKSPVFLNSTLNISSISNYVHAGSYITTVTAYDPTTSQLIEKYSIVSEKSKPESNQKFFKIDSLTGVISLNNLPSAESLELVVSATSNQGLTSFAQLFVDFSTYFSDFYTNIMFDASNISDSVTLYNDRFYFNSIYRANAKCFSNYELTKIVSCGQVNYSIDFIQNTSIERAFYIDNKSGNLYLSTSKADKTNNRDDFVLIVNAQSQISSYPDRFIRDFQRQLNIFIDSPGSDIPKFEKNIYSLKLLETTPKDANILTIKYKSNLKIQLNVFIDRLSNFQIEKYFYLKHLAQYRLIYLFVKSSPISLDIPNINFVIKLTNLDGTISSQTQVDIKLLPSNTFSRPYPIFTQPNRASYLLVIDPLILGIVNNTPIFEFNSFISNQNSIIVYSIMNKYPLPFYIDNKVLKISYPFSDNIDPKKTSYLLFIEAKDIMNESSDPNYITIDVRVNSLVGILPYFYREPTNGPITLTINENLALNQAIFSLKNLTYVPTPKFYYYVFDNDSNKLSDTFLVDSMDSSLTIKKKLDAKIKNFYEIFVYITDKPTFSNEFTNPLSTNTALLFINLKILSQLTGDYGKFTSVFSYILLDEIVPIDYQIGFVEALSNNFQPKYEIITCDLISKTVTYKDPQFCELFKIDSENGIISTNSSNYSPFKGNYFSLRLSALLQNFRIYTEVFIIVADNPEKSRFVLPSLVPTQNFSLLNLKNQINIALNLKYNGLYRFEYCDFFMPFSSSLDSGLDVCFYIVQTNEKYDLSFKETVKIFFETKAWREIFGTFSVFNIERWTNKQDTEINGNLYDKNGQWELNSFSIGLLVLVIVLLLITILAVFCLELCWASFLRQSMLAPNIYLDTVETDSNRQNESIKLNLNSNFLMNQTIPDGFILIPKNYYSNQSTNSKYEVFLPIVFIISFMTLLFLIYAINNLSLKKHLRNFCCILFRGKRNNQLNYPTRIGFQGISTRPSIYWRPSNYNNYEDTHTDYYRIPPSDLYSHRNSNYHNYEQIYPYSNPNNLILNVQNNYKLSNFYSSESSSDYDPNTIGDKYDNKFYFDESKYGSKHNYTNRTQNYYHVGNLRSESKRIKSIRSEYGPFKNRKMLIRPIKTRPVRRSYSISRVDHNKWRKQLEKRNQKNYSGNWSSKIMSEYELKKFLVQENMLKTQTAQILRNNFSESFLNLNHSRANVLSEIYAHKNEHSSQNNLNSLTQNETTLNSKLESNEVLNSTESKKRYSITKSYSGLLSNKELSVFSSLDLDIQQKNELKNESIPSQSKKANDSLNKPNHFSSIVFNLSEINDLDKSKKKFKENIRQRSSTFKALNKQDSIKRSKENTFTKFSNKIKDLSSEGSLIKSICKEIKLATSVDKDLDKTKGKKYSRLCKSFTFLSQRVSENIRNKKQSFNEHKKINEDKVFASEPSKLGSVSILPISFKPGQINYLKNIHFLKSKGFQSMNSILEKVESVTNLKKSLNSTQDSVEAESLLENKENEKEVKPVAKIVIDAAVQTSIVTSNESSSFNSQVTSVMHSNNFGSILANFGSASIQFSQTLFNSKKCRLRAYSDGNCLSDSSGSNTKNSSSLGTHSASSSKLNHLKIQI